MLATADLELLGADPETVKAAKEERRRKEEEAEAKKRAADAQLQSSALLFAEQMAAKVTAVVSVAIVVSVALVVSVAIVSIADGRQGQRHPERTAHAHMHMHMSSGLSRWSHAPRPRATPTRPHHAPAGHRGQEGGGGGQEGRGGRCRAPAAGAAARCGRCAPLAAATPPRRGGRRRGRGHLRGPRSGRRGQAPDRCGRRGRGGGRGQTPRLRRHGPIGDEAPYGETEADAALPSGVRPPRRPCRMRKKGGG